MIDSFTPRSLSSLLAMQNAAASRGVSFSPLHRDFLGHHEDAIGKVEKRVLVGPDPLQIARFGKGAFDRVDAVGPHLRYPVVLGSCAGRVRQGLRDGMALDVFVEMAHEL